MQRIAIIGGGPAGATAAERLARSGLDVSLFEERPGWEKPCGGALPPRAMKRFPYLAEAARDHRAIADVEMVAAGGASVRFRLREPLLVYSRARLNGLLLRRAAEAGAAIVPERILSFRREGAAWRLKGRGGSYAADFVILAAGARSRLRDLVAPPFSARDFMLTFGYYAPGFDDLLRVQFFEDFEGYAWAFPRPDHLSLGICGKVGESDMRGLRARLDDFITHYGYDSLLPAGWRESKTPGPQSPARVFSHLLPALSVESWNNLRLAGERWALAGDAAGLVDSVTGEGIYFAMRSGELLAEALARGTPESYPERVRSDFGRRLEVGARWARFFYRGDFWGKYPSTRLIEFSAQSRAFRELFQDLVEGAQSYPGLAGRMYKTLARSAGEMAAGALRRARA